MRRWGTRFQLPRVGALALLLLVSCTEPADGPADEPGDEPPVGDPVFPTFEVSGWENPSNPLAWIVEVTSDASLPVHVEYGPMGTWTHRTPLVDLVADKTDRIQVLGLHGGALYGLRVVDPVSGRVSEILTAQTMAPTADWPSCTTWGEPGHPDEVFCTQYRHDNANYGGFFCADRAGDPVWFLNHPDEIRMQAMRRFRDGRHAAVSELSSKLVLFDRWGELYGEYGALWFEGRTRFVHDWINAHDVIELEAGRWEGALAIITSTHDDLSSGEAVLGEGIIVYDPFEDEVLWDWHSHGELGDDEPIDPKLGGGYVGEFWLHGNALLHTVEDDGAEAFWLSARDMNWVLKIDVDTDAVVWRLGRGGDFQLVDDLDADDPQPVENAAWHSKQHAPQITKRHGDRAQLLIFDNRSNLGDWSRVVGVEIDESTRRAQIIFEYGDEDPDSPEHFFSSIAGDADLMPGGESVLVADSRDDIALFEVGYPEGGERWRMECDGSKEMYRVTYRASIYD